MRYYIAPIGNQLVPSCLSIVQGFSEFHGVFSDLIHMHDR